MPAETPEFSHSLHAHQRKLTRPRQAVLDVIIAADRHLTPQDVFRRAKTRYSALGLTTVYRTLDLLVELGYIQRIHLDDGCHSYAARAGGHGHHLVCAQCGRAEGFADCDLEPLMRALQSRTGYAIELHMLELVGRCPECQGKAAAARRRAKTK
ncbi:MAG: transcriptional repressor [Chloroflexi bacterium]|nr:transcriptional repressor [Chloroflexota bacterium]